MTRIAFLLFAMILSACGTVNEHVFVDSTPRGARILDSQGRFTGQMTPAYVTLNPEIESHLLSVDKPGFRTIPVPFTRKTETEVMGPTEVVGTILCAPCCCGLPLLNFLDPVDINTRFTPNRVSLKLERMGGGIHVTAFPPHVEVVADGTSRGQLMSEHEVFVPLKEGTHSLVFRAPGFEDLRADDVLIEAETPVRLNVQLVPVAGSLYVKQDSGVKLSHVSVSRAGQGVVWDADVSGLDVIIRELEPGDYVLTAKATVQGNLSLEHSQEFSVVDKGLTTIHVSSFHEWKLRPWLGVELENTGSLKMKVDGIGVITFPSIKTVASGSPAEKAGLQVGDILLAVNGQSIGRESSTQDQDAIKNATTRLRKMIQGLTIGDAVFIELERSDKRVAVKVDALGATPDHVGFSQFTGSRLAEMSIRYKTLQDQFLETTDTAEKAALRRQLSVLRRELESSVKTYEAMTGHRLPMPEKVTTQE